jgi:septum formation protein
MLTRAGLVFDVDPADIDETALQGEDARALATRLARGKALAAAARHPGALVVGADQAGETEEGRALRKCWEPDDAVEQLCAMASRAHTFVSAAAIARDDTVLAEVSSSATVRFRAFDEAEARAYVALGEWRGSAGSYHLEGRGVRFVESLEGPEAAVYGLPLVELLGALREHGGA